MSTPEMPDPYYQHTYQEYLDETADQPFKPGGRLCEDYPCCGHTPQDPCDAKPHDWANDPHLMCEHELNYCEVAEREADEADDRDDSYDPQFREAEHYCVHGTYIGPPGGADILCGACEAGDEPDEPDHVMCSNPDCPLDHGTTGQPWPQPWDDERPDQDFMGLDESSSLHRPYRHP